MAGEHDKRRLTGGLRAEIQRATGRRYRIDLEALDLDSLRELRRLLQDLEDERRRAVQQARMTPWRLP